MTCLIKMRLKRVNECSYEYRTYICLKLHHNTTIRRAYTLCSVALKQSACICVSASFILHHTQCIWVTFKMNYGENEWVSWNDRNIEGERKKDIYRDNVTGKKREREMQCIFKTQSTLNTFNWMSYAFNSCLFCY